MKTERITIRVTEEYKKLLEREAEKQDVPVGQLIRKYIKEGLVYAANSTKPEDNSN